VKTGIQDNRRKHWIPAGVYPDENRGRNDEQKIPNRLSTGMCPVKGRNIKKLPYREAPPCGRGALLFGFGILYFFVIWNLKLGT
jgi:hypothetical protein